MIDVVEVLQHWHAGRPKSVVASSLGIDPKTVRKYVSKAVESGLAPGGPVLGRAEWAELVRGWFPELVDAKARSLTFGVIDAHRERIEDMLVTNTVSTVHQRLRDEHGLAVGISSFRRFVGSEFPDESLRDSPPLATRFGSSNFTTTRSNPCDTRLIESASCGGRRLMTRHRHRPCSGGLSRGYAAYLTPPDRWIED